MPSPHDSHPNARLTLILSAGLLAAAAVSAQTGKPSEPSTADLYRQEVKACQAMKAREERQTCLYEARQARAERQRGALTTPTPEQMRANAMARCQGMRDSDMAACHARMMGYGSSSGSVTGGGMMRELEVVEMPPGQTSVTIMPRSSSPVLVVPAPTAKP